MVIGLASAVGSDTVSGFIAVLCKLKLHLGARSTTGDWSHIERAQSSSASGHVTGGSLDKSLDTG